MGLQTIQSGSFNIQKSPSGVTENATTTRASSYDLNVPNASLVLASRQAI